MRRQYLNWTTAEKSLNPHGLAGHQWKYFFSRPLVDLVVFCATPTSLVTRNCLEKVRRLLWWQDY